MRYIVNIRAEAFRQKRECSSLEEAEEWVEYYEGIGYEADILTRKSFGW